MQMKIKRKEIGIFIGGILALSLVLLICDLTSTKESKYESGSHGVYDHDEAS